MAPAEHAVASLHVFSFNDAMGFQKALGFIGARPGAIAVFYKLITELSQAIWIISDAGASRAPSIRSFSSILRALAQGVHTRRNSGDTLLIFDLWEFRGHLTYL
jgi:hypothetical protein